MLINRLVLDVPMTPKLTSKRQVIEKGENPYSVAITFNKILNTEYKGIAYLNIAVSPGNNADVKSPGSLGTSIKKKNIRPRKVSGIC